MPDMCTILHIHPGMDTAEMTTMPQVIMLLWCYCFRRRPGTEITGNLGGKRSGEFGLSGTCSHVHGR
jgi:hypothetical protein